MEGKTAAKTPGSSSSWHAVISKDSSITQGGSALEQRGQSKMCRHNAINMGCQPLCLCSNSYPPCGTGGHTPPATPAGSPLPRQAPPPPPPLLVGAAHLAHAASRRCAAAGACCARHAHVGAGCYVGAGRYVGAGGRGSASAADARPSAAPRLRRARLPPWLSRPERQRPC